MTPSTTDNKAMANASVIMGILAVFLTPIICTAFFGGVSAILAIAFGLASGARATPRNTTAFAGALMGGVSLVGLFVLILVWSR